MASDDVLWSNLFKVRWGGDHAAFYAPLDAKSWKNIYEVQDRCDRVGLGLNIIREGGDYYLVHQGEIQRYLGSKKRRMGVNSPLVSKGQVTEEEYQEREEPCFGILDKILFFIGDLEVASRDAKRKQAL